MQALKVERYQQLNRRWRPALMAFFLRRVRNGAEAEDLTQEVFARLIEHAGEDKPDAYVFQIAQNLIRDNARKSAVRSLYERAIDGDLERDVDWLSPHDVAAGREELATFAAALAQLAERTRTIFVLFRLEDMSQDEIAAAYGISVSAVKKQIAKATAHLAKSMRGEFR